jgi:hypothetical protein
MIFSKMKKPVSLLALASALIAFLIFVNDSFASVTWLSSITNVKNPTRVAVDSQGNLFVTEPNDINSVTVFDRRGNYVTALGGLQNPIGIAVSGSKVYVGNQGSKSVDVYSYANGKFALSAMLGTGSGEFKAPDAIAVSKSGMIYVADRLDHRVKAYNPNGSLALSFGGYGGNSGQFNQPVDLAVNDSASEIYILDSGVYTDENGNNGKVRIQVFDMNGNFRRTFGTYGTGDGNLIKALGIALDSDGKAYISDAFQGLVEVFDSAGNFIETIKNTDHPMNTPIGVAIGGDKRMFVASSSSSGKSPSVEVYGLPGYTGASLSPSSLTFAVTQGDTDPAAQTVTVWNSGTGALDWTTKTSTTDGAKWLSATQSGSAGAGGSANVSVSVKTSGLVPAVYTGTVAVTMASGLEENITVTLTVSVPPAVLNVVPGKLSFKAQQGGADPQAQSFTITNSGGGNMSWSASTNKPEWMKLTISSSYLTVAPTIAGLAKGSHTGTVTVTASGAQGSPADLPVTLEISTAGTVKVSANISNASFELSGPATYSGSGTDWSNDSVQPGDYNLSFKHVPGYLKPVSKNISVKTGQESVVSADYRKKAVPTHIVAGSADKDSREMAVMLLPFDADNAPLSFVPFSSADSIRVSAGDVEAGGIDKIVVTDNKRSLKVFSEQGALLASYDLGEDYSNADAATGDIDNDGKADILLAAVDKHNDKRVIKVLSYAANAIQEKATLFTEDKDNAFTVAIADVNDDGQLEVLIADSSSIRAFSVEQPATLKQQWVKNGDYGASGSTPQIAAGDLNGDGAAEIAVSYDRAKGSKGRREKEQSSVISVLKGNGEDYGLTIEPFKDMSYTKPATVVMGDIDGDTADELVAGAGPRENNDPLIRTFESDGTYAGTTMKPMNGSFGVNVGLGKFQ